MEATNPNPDPSSYPLKIPTQIELYDFFNRFMGDWLKVSSQRVDRDEDDIPYLPNERSLLFSQPTSGVLVIRTSEEFGKALKKLAEANDSHSDLFVEMTVLFWHRFVSKFWGMDSRNLAPALFKKSLPKQWPDRKTDVFLSVFVLNQPIGIRLWTHLTDAEIKRWKNE